jgi:hypothetical protein
MLKIARRHERIAARTRPVRGRRDDQLDLGLGRGDLS